MPDKLQPTVPSLPPPARAEPVQGRASGELDEITHAAFDPMREIVERVRAITAENERLFQQLIAGERRFRSLARAVWKVQEEERRRLARELHDGIGQTLTALKNQLELLNQETAGADPGPRARLADSIEIAAHALQETRELSRLLRPPVLDDLGLLAALGWLARTLHQRTGLEVELRAEGLGERLDPEAETLVFRVTQEALTNVLKHAGVARAEIDLSRGPGGLRLRIADRGRGFEPDRAGGEHPDAQGCGLRGIRDRVELFGGVCRVRSQPGAGTAVEVELPLPELDESGARESAR